MLKNLFAYAYEKELEILRDMSSGVGAYTDEEFFRIIKNTIHSLLDCEERIRNQITEEDKDFFLAFKYANNQLKHDNGFKNLLERKAGGTFPAKVDGTAMFYHYAWCSNEKLGEKCRHIDQKAAYEKYLQGKATIYTFEQINSVIHKYI